MSARSGVKTNRSVVCPVRNRVASNIGVASARSRSRALHLVVEIRKPAE
jgi:hypothetical protein